jgi:uncharacterized protein YegP (UPF0339 family)
MSKTKLKPGIHLHRRKSVYQDINGQYYWNIVAKNGRIIARSSETYTRKAGAVKSIAIAAMIFAPDAINNLYYDHSKPDSPLQSYL